MVMPTAPTEQVAAQPPAAPVARRARRRQRNTVPYLLLAPTVLFLAVFFAWPMVQALILAFQDSSGQWSLAPVERMVNDLRFTESVRNTLVFAAVVIPLQTVLALAMALLLMSNLRGAGAFLYLWAIPLGISDLASGVVWLSIFTDRGYINSVLNALGLSDSGYPFLSYENPLSLFVCAAIAEVWRATSIVMVVLLSGLQVIPKDYGEAAEVFGATAWQRFTKVTLPLLRPSLQVALILRTILAFQVFAVVIALAGRQLPVLAEEAYQFYYTIRSPNTAAAYALLIMVLSLGFTVVYLRLLRVRDAELGRG
ncbi:MAG TPA: sugar ABC transporter permease [Chloroflexota bacterium]|nr:sugar ABC transporter permease [Chloroflexota bacterium]